MSKLDSAWAIQQLDEFLHVTAQVAYDNSPGSDVVVFGTHMRGGQTQAAELAHVVEQILDRVLPGWPRSNTGRDKSNDKRWAHLREQVARAKAAIEREDELREKLGDGAPQMDAGSFHPWVWEAASSLWHTGHFRQAVHMAAIAVNANTQKKLDRRDASETNLFKQAFSLDSPSAGKPRLRLAVDDGSDTYKSIHRGAMAFAEGLYAAIRNPLNHDLQQELEEQVALEQLAAFSVLARWVDDAQLKKE
ncbi:MAG: TIGR02391 family protein [Cryobacterium sp.]|nr:TIGR02391 family protein [Cryobacterium sp.]